MDNQVEEIKQKTDIVSLVGERVKLSRAGRNFKAACPFHSERTPSFMVSPELNIYKCFGCGKAGDVFNFLDEFEGMEFPEALVYLAKRAGVVLKPFSKDKNYEKKERLWEVVHLASEFYHYLLTEHRAGERARKYLQERGVHKSAIKSFKLGFAPEKWELLIRYLTRKKNYSLKELELLGLVIKGAGGKSYDRFRNRIIFPLRDSRGHVIGLAGRILPGTEKEGGKYINSPETELYHKSKHLFGIYENKAEIKKKDEAILVEGELDAISSWQVGVKNVLAVKGTALTTEQVELIRRYTRNILLALDADAAGDAATKRSIALADSLGLNIKVVLISGGKDPDDICQTNPKKWKKLIQGATSVYDYYIKSAAKRFDLQIGSGKKQASEEVIPILAKITNSVEKAHYVKKFAKAAGVVEDSVNEEIRRFERSAALGNTGVKAVREKEGAGEQGPRDEMLEKYLLSLVLRKGGELLKGVKRFSPDLISGLGRKRIFLELIEESGKKYKAGNFISKLPAELKEAAQTLYLADLDLENDDLAAEAGRVTEELNKIRLREKLKTISDKVETLEVKTSLTAKEEKELEGMQKELGELSHQLSHGGKK